MSSSIRLLARLGSPVPRNGGDMPPRSIVDQFPEEIREELNQKLIKNSFGKYTDLTGWLNKKGYKISRSALHAYGQSFEERVDALQIATEQARALVESSPDDDDAMGNALVRLTQEKLFQLLMKLQVDPAKISLPQLTRAIADLGRVSIVQKQWRANLREATEKAAASVEKVVREGGLSKETAAWARREILGIRKALDDTGK